MHFLVKFVKVRASELLPHSPTRQPPLLHSPTTDSLLQMVKTITAISQVVFVKETDGKHDLPSGMIKHKSKFVFKAFEVEQNCS